MICAVFGGLATMPSMAQTPAPGRPSDQERPGAGSSQVKPLTIPEAHRAVSPKGAQLIVLLDFFPLKQQLEAAGTQARELIIETARVYAGEYLAKPAYASLESAVIFVVYIDSMDEYNRANFSGTKRFGTLTFKRDRDTVVLTENKLSIDDKALGTSTPKQ